MAKMSFLDAARSAAVILVLVLSDACPISTCHAAVVNFINGGDFNAPANWDDGNPPTDDFDQHFVQDDLIATFTTGETSVFQLTIGDTATGQLDVSGGNLTITGDNRFEVGRSATGSGVVNISGTGVLTSDGAVVGTRSDGVVNIGPGALLDLKDADDTDRDIRIGSFGPGFNPSGEPDLDGNGLVVVEGTLDGASAIISQSAARGELRLEPGGTIDLANRLWMNLCENCADASTRSAKVSIRGSSGTFNVGGGDILADTPSAIFAYTADSGGVTPIIALSGAEIDTAALELNLDAFSFTPSSTLTLIDAIPGLLFGNFGSVAFAGNTTATVNYDLLNGDVFLDNFQRTGGPDVDLDDDNDVDGADLLLIQRSVPSAIAAWQMQFGSPFATVSAAGVPEPATAALLFAAAAYWAIGTRRAPIGKPGRSIP